MSNNIGWCDCTINPVVGCAPCSPGCNRCYAARFASRLAKNPQTAAKYRGVVDGRGWWNGEVSDPDWSCFAKLPKAPRRVFVGSMTDIFYDPTATYLRKLFTLMASFPQHIFLLLTKRPENMKFWLDTNGDCPQNIWLGVTVCDQDEADTKLPVLMESRAHRRFVSIEPMLGPIDLEAVSFKHSEGFFGSPLRWHHIPNCRREELKGGEIYPALNWVICGGESGPGARQMHQDWVRCLRDQCVEAGVPFYFKGWGETKKTPALLDGREWREFPKQEKA